MFISFDQCGITGCVKFPLYGMRRLYASMASVNQFHDDIRGQTFESRTSVDMFLLKFLSPLILQRKVAENQHSGGEGS
jgi:hypothetical protein